MLLKHKSVGNLEEHIMQHSTISRKYFQTQLAEVDILKHLRFFFQKFEISWIILHEMSSLNGQLQTWNVTNLPSLGDNHIQNFHSGW